MIVRVATGLFAFAVLATVRGLRRRARRKRATPPSMTVRNGYTGLENLLYRVVIERGGPADGATFRWSRDGEPGTTSASIPVQAGSWISLGNGIDICFEGETFAPGDFWSFPALSAADTVTKKALRRGAPSARGRAKRRR